MEPRDSSVTLQSWNEVAQLYLDRFGELDLYDAGYDAFCSQVKKTEASILELGCGPGNLTRALLKRRPDFRILALDAAPEMIRIAGSYVPDAQFECQDVRDLSAYTGPYDGIVSGFCIPYLNTEELGHHLSECARRLRKGGIFYLSFVDGDPAQSGWVKGSGGQAMEFFYHQKEQLLSWMKSLGLQLNQEMEFSFPRENALEVHVLLLAQKA